MALRSRVLVPIVVAALSWSPVVAADDARFGKHDVRSVFVIAKNIDRDEVRYGVHLDQDCAPRGPEPMHAYWQQIEQGPGVVEDLNFLDQTVYGIKEQRVTKRSAEESKVLMTLKATPDRAIAVVIHKREGRCVAEAVAFINAVPSFLDRVFVHVAGFLKVDWVEIMGRANGKQVVERVKH